MCLQLEYCMNTSELQKIMETSLIFHIYLSKIKHQLLIALFQVKGEILLPDLMIKILKNIILIVMLAYCLKRFWLFLKRLD